MIRDLHTVIAYLKWLPKTFHLHGIHSPFIFNLEKKVLRGISEDSKKTQLQSYRNSLLHSNEVIVVEDYGYGSKVFNSEKRSVKAIAKVAGATQKRQLLLQRLVRHFQPKEILELGTSLGLSTAALAIENTGTVTSIEGCAHTAAVAKKQLVEAGYKNINILTQRFDKALRAITNQTYELIYFDGNHSKSATLNYFKQLVSTASDNTIWIFDDIHWSSDMSQAWEEIKRHEKISATIDCFWFGMVFFRSQQAKEDFYIRL